MRLPAGAGANTWLGEAGLPAGQNTVIESEFVGKHIGEFAGIRATGKNVSAPICVVYDLEGDQALR